jgi:hypothetical protein
VDAPFSARSEDTVIHLQWECREVRIGTRKLTLEDFRGISVEGAAELIRFEPVEHAVIYSRTGRALHYARSRAENPYRVTIPIGKSGLIRGNVFVHNHPGSESFSAEDIWILLRHGAREVRAYGPKRSFRMIAAARTRRIGTADAVGAWPDLDSRYRRSLLAAAPLFEHLVEEHILSAGEAWAARTHAVVREMSVRYRFAYTEI